MGVFERNNVKVGGRGETPMVFAHGYGCDQTMWRLVTPAFEDDYRIVLFDTVGMGASDVSAYDRRKYGTLRGYTDDLLEICRALELDGAVLVGHSVSAIVSMLAAIEEPQRFRALVMVAPSPCYVDDGDYVGGFQRSDIDELLESLESNYLGWASAIAPTITGRDNPEALAEELANSFCRTDPEIAKHFARVTFLSDNRADLPRVRTRSLILQCSDDVIAPRSVGEYMHRNVPNSELVVLSATGHCPHLSAPDETIAAMKQFL